MVTPQTWLAFHQRCAERGLLAPLIEVCIRYHLTLRDVFEGGRRSAVVRARHDCWLHLAEKGWSTTEVGLLFGVHHTSVVAGLAQARARRAAEG